MVGTWDFHSWLAQGLAWCLWAGCSTFLFVSWLPKKVFPLLWCLWTLAVLLWKLHGVSLLKVCGILWYAMRYLLPDPSYFLQRSSDHHLMIVEFLNVAVRVKPWVYFWSGELQQLTVSSACLRSTQNICWFDGERISVMWSRWQVCLGLLWQLESQDLDTALWKIFFYISDSCSRRMDLMRNRPREEVKAVEGNGKLIAWREALMFRLCSLARCGWIGDTVCFPFVFWQ